MRGVTHIFLIVVAAVVQGFAYAELVVTDPAAVEAAREAMLKGVAFFRGEVSAEGLYVWRYSADLKLREGEGKAGPLTGWVQPPGTPSVGGAYLRAYTRTGEKALLEAAVETGEALMRGQLRSGGWDYRIELDPALRAKYAYRKEPGNPEGTNVTTLDDNTTQEALRFLMRLDRALDFNEERVHECVMYALEALQAAQYPNGAWPQRFTGPPDAARYPVKPANYPDAWPRQFPNEKYLDYYTFNDNSICDAMDVMLEAWEIYGDARWRECAVKAGEFMLLAQMPAPQRAWAQQYNAEMHPAWARKFEPPAVSGHESQTVLSALIDLAERTGENRFLATVPEAIEYLRSSLLPDGRLARFYELQTNKPLYFTQDYALTYEADDLPTHYSFRGASILGQLSARYERVKAGQRLEKEPRKNMAEAVQDAVAAQDERGAWVTGGNLRTFSDAGTAKIVDTRVFIQRLDALSAWLGDSGED